MNRRDFIKTIRHATLAAASMSVLDPEFFLWKPGARTFYLPTPKAVSLAPVIAEIEMIDTMLRSDLGRFGLMLNERAYEDSQQQGEHFDGLTSVSVLRNDGTVWQLQGDELRREQDRARGAIYRREAHVGAGMRAVTLTDEKE